MKKRSLAFLLAVVMLLGMIAVPAYAAENVVYLNGSYAGTDSDGTAAKPYKTLEEAFASIPDEESGTIVLLSDYTIQDTYQFPVHTGKISITGTTADTKINATSTAKPYWDILTPLEFHDLTIQFDHATGKSLEIFAGASLTFGENMTFICCGGTITASADGHICVRMGYREKNKVCDVSRFAIESGTISYIQGGSRYADVGDSYITVSGTAVITDHIQGSGTYNDVNNSYITIEGGSVAELAVGGYGSGKNEAHITGSSNITITGGEIARISGYRKSASANDTLNNVTMSIGGDAVVGSIDMSGIAINGTNSLTISNSQTLNAGFGDFWDSVTIGEGAKVSLSETFSLTEKVGDTNVLTVEKDAVLELPGGSTAPAYNGSGTIVVRSDEGGETEPSAPEPLPEEFVGKLTEVWLDDTAANGGDGTREKPVNTMENAFAALKPDEAGTIYVVGEYNVSDTSVDGSGDDNNTYRFPDHAKKVTITGAGDDATLNFDAPGKILVQFRCPVELNNLTWIYRHDGGNMDIYAGQKLTVGENMKFSCTKDGEIGKSCLAIRGGYYSNEDPLYHSEHIEQTNIDTEITVLSGRISYMMGGNGQTNVGNATINFGGTAELVVRMQGAGANGGDVENSTINITGGTIADLVIIGHGLDGSDANVNGNSVINITGGTINKIITDRTKYAKHLGDITMTVGGTASIGSIDLSASLITTEKTQQLIFSDSKDVQLSAGFGEGWDSITVSENSELHYGGIYAAGGETQLNLEDGAILYLNSSLNETEPPYNKTGSAQTGKIVMEISHISKAVAGKEPSGVESGYKAHYRCTVCDKFYTDEACTVETTLEDLIIPATESVVYHTDYVEGSNFALTHLMTASGGQGNAISGNTLITANNTGYANMYDLRTGLAIADFPLASHTDTSSGAYANHANQIMFGSEKFDESDPFPLLYITIGNSGIHDDTGAYVAKCSVERILYSEKIGWYAECVQIIEFNDYDNIPGEQKDMNVSKNNGDILLEMYDPATGTFPYVSGNGYDAAKGYQKIGWGWPASFVDSDPTGTTAGKFYLYSARYRTTQAYEGLNRATYGNGDPEWDYYDPGVNSYIITEFDMPALPASVDDPSYGKVTTLYTRDITNQFTTEYNIGFTQGGTMYQGKIYYSYGNKGAADNLYLRNGIQVFDIAQEKIVAFLPLYDSEVKGMEPECTSIWNGELVLGLNGGGYEVYALDYVALDPQTEEPTCTENGYSHINCSLCGILLSSTEEAGSALGHDLVKTEAKAPTSTSEGNIEYYTCTVCGKLYTDATAAKEITLEDTVIPKVDVPTDGSPETGELVPMGLVMSVMLLSCLAFVVTYKKRVI